MKKLIIALAAVFAFAFSANAQFGIIAGVTSSKTDIKEAYADVKNITQYHVGATYKIPLVMGLAVQPGIIYNVKGSKIEDVTGMGDIDFKSGYLEIPVQVQWGFDLAVARPYIFAEPFLGYAVSSQAKFNIKEIGGSDWEDIKDQLKSRVEYGIGLGAGIDIFKKLQVSVRYFWNLDEFTIKDISDAVKGKNNGVCASVAFFF